MPTKLGQNFLTEPTIVEKIIASSAIARTDFVLEIGPGKGILSEKILEKADHLLAVELDQKLIAPLQEKFASKSNFSLIQGDILKINLPEIIQGKWGSQASYKVIANIPYYITSPIIRLFLESKIPPQEMILMIQKEVAERIVAKPGSMSILAVSVQYYAKAEILFPVDRSFFSPSPQVDSAVIRILPQKKFAFPEDRSFFRLVRSGFASKRKTLLNNLLAASFSQNKKELSALLQKSGFSEHTRSQELSVEDWKKLHSNLLEK